MTNRHDSTSFASVPLNDINEKTKPTSALGALFQRCSVDSVNLPKGWSTQSFGPLSLSSVDVDLDVILGRMPNSLGGTQSLSDQYQKLFSSLTLCPDTSRSPPSFDLSIALSSIGSLSSIPDLPTTSDFKIGSGLSWMNQEISTWGDSFLMNLNSFPVPAPTSDVNPVVTPPGSPVSDGSTSSSRGRIEVGDDGPPTIFRACTLPPSSTTITLRRKVQEKSHAKATRVTSKKTSPLPTVVLEENNRVSSLLPTDIVSGRGSGVYEHPGNVLMRDVVTTYAEYYKRLPEANRKEKTNVAKKIVQELQQGHGARFLKRKSNSWVIASDKEAQEKISRALREDYGNATKYKMKREHYKKH